MEPKTPSNTNKRQRVEQKPTSPEKIPAERLKFLYEKNVMAWKDQDTRKREFDMLNDPDSAETPMLQEHYRKCQQRLDRILSKTGDAGFDSIPAEVQTFEEFCEIVPGWDSSETSYVFHRDCEILRGHVRILKQRAQLSGLCYIHGPDMLQHYVVSMRKENVGMIDITRFIRGNFSSEELEQHIFDDSGGNSHILLERILMPRSIIFSSRFGMYLQDLKTYGPGLVSCFEVRKDFIDKKENGKDACKYHGDNSDEIFVGNHCMVLIGARTVESTTYYLLQNWWKSKQFVEVDEEYLKRSGATVYFVKTPQDEIPTQFPTTQSLYAENENLDKSESYAMIEY